MSEKEKQAAKEVIDSLKQIPPDGADYVRGYLQGRLDGIKAEKKEEEYAHHNQPQDRGGQSPGDNAGTARRPLG